MKTILLFLATFCFGTYGMDNTAASLDAKIKEANIPIHGVSIGKTNDKTTWRIDFKDEATEEQKLQAQQILQSFDVQKDVVPVKTDKQVIAELEARLKALEDKGK